ncbi:MAG: hypothetical protein AB8B62_18830 [Roseobacter sp.]
MSHEMTAVLVFGALCALVLVLLVLEQRGIAKRKAARGGREIDLSDIIAFGAPGPDGAKRNDK